MKGYMYNATKNEREVLDSEKIKLIITTEGNKTVIDGGKIMTNSITAKSIAADSIYANHIVTDAIKTGHISAGSIVSRHIKAESILSTHIQSDTILAKHIKSEQIKAIHIKSDTIIARHIKSDEIEARHIKAQAITADKIKAGEVILPDEKYGGVYINSTGLNMINTANHVALSAEKGLKIHNNLRGKTVFWANPTTGEIEMDVSKLTINSSNVYTEDNLIIGGTNIFRGKPKNEDLISKVNNIYFDSYNFLTEVGEQVPIEPEIEYIFTADVQMISSTINSLMVSFGYANKDGNFLYDGPAIHYDAKIKNQKIKQVIKFKKLTENQINSGSTYNLAIRFTRGAQVHTSEAIYSNIKLEKGNISTEWSPSPKDLLDLEKIKSGRNNLFILNTSEIGYLHSKGHIESPDAEQLTSDFIKIKSNTNYILQNWVKIEKDDTRIWNVVVEYNNEKKEIKRTYYTSEYRKKNYEDYLINNLKFNKETMYVRISSSFIEYFNNKVLFQEGNVPSDWNLAYEDTLNINSKNMLLNSKGNNLKDYSPWADTKISIENNFIKSYMSGKALYGITTPYLEEPIYKNKIYNFSFEIDNSLGEVYLNYLFLIDNNGANNQLLKSQTSKNGKINIVFISKRDNLKPRFLIGLDNRITGKESYPESFKIKYLNFKEGINSSDWTEAPQSQMNKEEINSRFILENQKIELGINTKIDNIQVGGVNLQEKTSNSIKYSSFKGWNAYLEPSSGPYKKGDVLTLSGYLISGINDVGLKIISTAETGNIIEYGQTNMIPPNSEGNVTSTVTVPVDTKNIKIVLRHNSGEAPESKTGYRSIQLERGNKQTDWSPSPKDSYNKEETDAKIKITKDKIDIGVNSKIENSNLGGTNLIDGTKDLIPNNQASNILSEKFKGNAIREGDWTKVGGNTYVDTYSTKMNINATDKTYVLSFYAKANIADKDFRTYFYSPNRVIYSENSDDKINDNGPDGNSYFKTSTNWKKYWVRYKINPIEEKLNIIVGRYFDKELKLQISSPMLVASEFPIEWSPSKNDSYTKEETDAKIKITKNEIDLSVSNKISEININDRNYAGGTAKKDIITGIGETVTTDDWTSDTPYTYPSKNAIGEFFREFKFTTNTELTVSANIKIYNPSGTLNLNDFHENFAFSIFRITGTGTSWRSLAILRKGNLKNNVLEYKIEETFKLEQKDIDTIGGTPFIRKWVRRIPINYKFEITNFKLQEGNKKTVWSPAIEDSYSKIETDAVIKIESDKINAGVKEEIKYSGVGSTNMILNSSMDNQEPCLVIDGIRRNTPYKTKVSYTGNSWMRITNFNTTEHHLYDIGSSTPSISHVGFERYNFENLEEGDIVTFSAELNNISSDIAKLEMFYDNGANNWTTTQGSEELKEGTKKIVSVKTTVPKDTKAILFRIYTGNKASGVVEARKVMAVKSNILQEWKPNPEDLVNNVYNSNLLENSDFLETNEIGQQAKNPDNYAQKWSMYNSGIGNATTNYHAYVSDSKFGYNVTVYNESDGTRHWKGINQQLNAEEIKVVNNGGKLWFSVDMYKEGNQLGNARVWGGMYYYDKTNNRQFHDGSFYIFSSIVGEWERKSAYVPFDVTKVDLTKPILFYIYGHGFTDNSKLYIKDVKLEIGKFVTPYKLSSKDIVKVSEMRDVQLQLEPDAISQTVTSSQTFNEWSDEAIGGKANQVDLDDTNESLENTKKVVEVTEEKVGSLVTRADSIEGSVTTIEKRVDKNGEYVKESKKFFTFNDNFLTIRASESPFNINITDKQLSFRNGTTETAYMNGQKLFITEAEVLNSIIIGKHMIQSDSTTTQTIFKYIE